MAEAGFGTLRKGRHTVAVRVFAMRRYAGVSKEKSLQPKARTPERQSEAPAEGGISNKDGGRYRIRTYDFHRVKMALYR